MARDYIQHTVNHIISEQSYSVYALTQPIAIDLEGRAHIFKEVQPFRKSSDNTEPSGVRKWECDTRICRLPAESVEGVTALLNSLKATKQRYYKHFYLHLDDCNNSTRDNRLGHSLYRSRENDCHSLLRPALTLAPHFPHLRLIVCRLYELRRLVQSMQFVESAMQSGDFDRLKRSMKELDSTMLQLRPQSTQSPTKALVTKWLKTAFCKSLADHSGTSQKFETATSPHRAICANRCVRTCALFSLTSTSMDTIPTACEMRSTFYTSTRLKRKTTKISSAASTFANTGAAKLRGNKEVAHSFYNQLSVIPAPDCITCLNMFERALIKFCMTCITVVRLGHIKSLSTT